MKIKGQDIGAGKTRKCRMCQKSEETLRHIFQECEFTRVMQGKSWKEILNGERKNLAKLLETQWKRRRLQAEGRREQGWTVVGAETAVCNTEGP